MCSAKEESELGSGASIQACLSCVTFACRAVAVACLFAVHQGVRTSLPAWCLMSQWLLRGFTVAERCSGEASCTESVNTPKLMFCSNSSVTQLGGRQHVGSLEKKQPISRPSQRWCVTCRTCLSSQHIGCPSAPVRSYQSLVCCSLQGAPSRQHNKALNITNSKPLCFHFLQLTSAASAYWLFQADLHSSRTLLVPMALAWDQQRQPWLS